VSLVLVFVAVAEGVAGLWLALLLAAIAKDRRELRAIARFYDRMMAEEREKRRSSAAGP
jgi:hypothetical protein